MSQGPMSTSPSKGGRMPSQQPSYQSPFGNQNYRTQTSPSKGGQPSFGGPAYQQPGQFGGQIMNRPMQSPGGKGGQSRQPVGIPPMPSPGGKGRSYQRPPTPYGYGQSTFNPGQFAGYGQPSNIFSFNNPHYQPYMPPTYDSGQTGQSPDIGNNPMTPQPEVMAEQSAQPLVSAVPPDSQTRTVSPRAEFMPPGGLFQSMGLGGKGGGSSYIPEGYYNIPDPDPNALRVFDPYGPGGSLEGRPRFTFPDPTQPQGPQGTVQSLPTGIPNLGGKGGSAKVNQIPEQFPTQDPGMSIDQQNQIDQQIMRAQQDRSAYAFDQLRNPDVPALSQQNLRRVVNMPSAPSQSIPEFLNLPRESQQPMGIAALGGPRLVPSSGPANPYAIGGPDNGQINQQQVDRDRAAYAASRLGQAQSNPPPQKMR